MFKVKVDIGEFLGHVLREYVCASLTGYEQYGTVVNIW